MVADQYPCTAAQERFSDSPCHGGCCSVQGGRSYNEDRHVVRERFHRVADGDDQEAWLQLFGVFDGHGGSKVSEFCASNIPDLLKAQLDSSAQLTHLLRHTPKAQLTTSAIQQVAICLANTFVSVDKALSEDMRLSEEAQLMGTTAVAALLCKEHIWVANCGDSRAVVCRGGVAKALSSDHKASCPIEAARIAQAGGVILQNGGSRLMGILTVTRAIGDHALHPHGLTPTPDVTYYRRSPADQFLILASDGLWDVMSDQEASDLVNRVFTRAQGHSSGVKPSSLPNIAASVLTRVAIARGSQDNITATVVDLRPPSETRQRRGSRTVTVDQVKQPGIVSPACNKLASNLLRGAECIMTPSEVISDELAALPSESDSEGRSGEQREESRSRTATSTPFAAEQARESARKRFGGEMLEEQTRACKVQRGALSRGLSSAGCSGEVQIEAQRSGFLAVQEACY